MAKLNAQPIVEIKDLVKCFSVGTIFGLSDQLLSGMDNAHRASLPSHFSMYLDALIDHDMAASLKDVEGVEDVEPLNRISALYKVRPGEARRHDHAG